MLGSSLLGPSAVRALPVRAAASHLASRRQQQHCCRRWQACAAQPDDSEFEDLPVIGQPSGRPGEGAQEALIKSLQGEGHLLPFTCWPPSCAELLSVISSSPERWCLMQRSPASKAGLRTEGTHLCWAATSG